jgi:hypothetical protein
MLIAFFNIYKSFTLITFQYDILILGKLDIKTRIVSNLDSEDKVVY